MTATVSIRAGRRTVPVSRPEKVLFPQDGLTKEDLARYYRSVARLMLPQLRGRPLTLERHPDGVEDHGFLQKDVPDHFPDWLHRAELPKEGGTVTYAVCDEPAALVYLADQACVTLHRMLSRASRPDRPDRMVFDLDPADDDFGTVRRAALELHDLLDELGLPAQVMTTGSRGLHVLVPLDGRADFDQVRDLARRTAELLASRHPDELTTAARKAARHGRLYLDVQRNAYGQIAVAPYSVRALPGAPVAAPVGWDTVAGKELTAQRWRLTDAAELLADNPWSPAPRPRSLARAEQRLRAAEEAAHERSAPPRTRGLAA
jgi:bifunctional non-homologous end joining protein LigD